jgi:hypothetical protein
VLLATTAIALVWPVVATAAQQGHVSDSNAADGSAQPSAERHGSIADGAYAVLREGPTRTEVDQEKAPHFALYYDYKYIDSEPKPAPKYVALDSSSFVPLILARPPEIKGEYRGHPILSLAIAPEHVKLLENFTRAHLGGSVAIVIDQEIITISKIRSVIADGEVLISRCTDDACQILRIKLTK